MSADPIVRNDKPLQGDAALIRAVGSFALAAAVMNIIVGGGIFRMPSALSGQVGIAAPLALVAGALAIIPVALCFAAIGSRAVATGGPYSYLGATFGSFAGFLAGALMWISNVASSAGVAAAFAVQVANLVPWFGQPLPREVIFYDVPRPLVRQLGAPPSGHRYVRVAADILLITAGTAMVVDAVQDLGRM